MQSSPAGKELRSSVLVQGVISTGAMKSAGTGCAAPFESRGSLSFSRQGLLSIGIDDSSNTLIVSSSGSLMDTIGEMIESLDAAADSSSVVQVIHVDETVDLGLIEERLRELMKVKPVAEQPGQQPPQQPGQQPPGMPPGANPAESVGN